MLIHGNLLFDLLLPGQGQQGEQPFLASVHDEGASEDTLRIQSATEGVVPMQQSLLFNK